VPEEPYRAPLPVRPGPRVRRPRPQRLFTAIAVAVPALLFPPFGAALALVNYRRLADERGGWLAAVLFGVPALAWIGFLTTPHTQQQDLLLLVARVVLTVAVYLDQRRLGAAHFAAGGAKARWWLAWLAAIPGFILFLAFWQIMSPASPAR
jgi:hypothetical protein